MNRYKVPAVHIGFILFDLLNDCVFLVNLGPDSKNLVQSPPIPNKDEPLSFFDPGSSFLRLMLGLGGQADSTYPLFCLEERNCALQILDL